MTEPLIGTLHLEDKKVPSLRQEWEVSAFRDNQKVLFGRINAYWSKNSRFEGKGFWR